MNELNNTVTALGNYESVETSLSALSTVNILTGLTMSKIADKQYWADGELTYTIEIDNQTTQSYESPVLTDKLDTTLVSFVDNSVTINGSAAQSSDFTYESSTGTLTVNVPTVEASGKATVTFKVSKVS